MEQGANKNEKGTEKKLKGSKDGKIQGIREFKNVTGARSPLTDPINQVHLTD